MRYVSDLHNGRVNPKQFEFGLNVNRRKYKLADFLRTQVVSAPQVAPVLEQVEPPFPAYRRTMAALDHYLALAKEGDGQLLAVSKKSIKPGEPYSNVPQLAERLRRLGDLTPDVQVAADSSIYQGPDGGQQPNEERDGASDSAEPGGGPGPGNREPDHRGSAGRFGRALRGRPGDHLQGRER